MQNPASHNASTGDIQSAEVGAPSSQAEPSELPLLDALHGAAPAFRDESLAPEVDRDLLLRLVQGQLSEPEARLVFRLVESFRSWRDAHNEVLVAEAKRPQ